MLELIANSYNALGQMDRGDRDDGRGSGRANGSGDAGGRARHGRCPGRPGWSLHGKGDYERGRRSRTRRSTLFEQNGAADLGRGRHGSGAYRGCCSRRRGQSQLAEVNHRRALNDLAPNGCRSQMEAARDQQSLRRARSSGSHGGGADPETGSARAADRALRQRASRSSPPSATTSPTASTTPATTKPRKRLYREALEINEGLLGAENVGVATFLTNLGRVLMDQERYKEAEPYIRRAVDMRQETR